MPFADVQPDHLGTIDGRVGEGRVGRSSSRIHRSIAVLSAGILAFAGCGGSNGSSDDNDDGDDATSSPPTTSVEAYGIEQDTVVDLAPSMSRRPGSEPGWELDARSTDLVPVHEGWSFGAMGTASREIDWYDADGQLEAEMSISIGHPGRFGQVWRPDFGATFADVDGSQAMIVHYDYSATDAPTIVVWSSTEDHVVQFGVMADPQRALDIARGIDPVSEETWNSAARPPDAPRDGCNSFVC